MNLTVTVGVIRTTAFTVGGTVSGFNRSSLSVRLPTGSTTIRDAAIFISKSGGSNSDIIFMAASLTNLFFDFNIGIQYNAVYEETAVGILMKTYVAASLIIIVPKTA